MVDTFIDINGEDTSGTTMYIYYNIGGGDGTYTLLGSVNNTIFAVPGTQAGDYTDLVDLPSSVGADPGATIVVI
jgi:hypothetical protein